MYLQGLNLSFSKASCHVIRLSSKWRVLLKNYYLICLVTRVCTQDVCNGTMHAVCIRCSMDQGRWAKKLRKKTQMVCTYFIKAGAI